MSLSEMAKLANSSGLAKSDAQWWPKWMETYARSIHQVDAPRIDISRESLISLLQRLRKIPQGTHHFVHSAGWLLRLQRFCQSHRLFRFDAFLKHAAQDCKRCVPAGSGDTPLRVLSCSAFPMTVILSVAAPFSFCCISETCSMGLQRVLCPRPHRGTHPVRVLIWQTFL